MEGGDKKCTQKFVNRNYNVSLTLLTLIQLLMQLCFEATQTFICAEELTCTPGCSVQKKRILTVFTLRHKTSFQIFNMLRKSAILLRGRQEDTEKCYLLNIKMNAMP